MGRERPCGKSAFLLASPAIAGSERVRERERGAAKRRIFSITSDWCEVHNRAMRGAFARPS